MAKIKHHFLVMYKPVLTVPDSDDKPPSFLAANLQSNIPAPHRANRACALLPYPVAHFLFPQRELQRLIRCNSEMS